VIGAKREFVSNYPTLVVIFCTSNELPKLSTMHDYYTSRCQYIVQWSKGYRIVTPQAVMLVFPNRKYSTGWLGNTDAAEDAIAFRSVCSM
jgi:hypothetical protein